MKYIIFTFGILLSTMVGALAQNIDWKGPLDAVIKNYAEVDSYHMQLEISHYRRSDRNENVLKEKMETEIIKTSNTFFYSDTRVDIFKSEEGALMANHQDSVLVELDDQQADVLIAQFLTQKMITLEDIDTLHQVQVNKKDEFLFVRYHHKHPALKEVSIKLDTKNNEFKHMLIYLNGPGIPVSMIKINYLQQTLVVSEELITRFSLTNYITTNDLGEVVLSEKYKDYQLVTTKK